MFYDKYLDSDVIAELFDNYDVSYLSSIDLDNFDRVFKIFREYGFDFTCDIVLRYLEIFEINDTVVRERLDKLIKVLGCNYIELIGNDMSLLEYIVRV